MDEYLSEKEQLERIREWWRENGWYLVGGVALGLIALAGWKQYQGHLQARAEQAAALYLDLQDMLDEDDRAAAEALLAELREAHASSPYTDHAGLLLAGAYLGRDPDRAADELRYVMERSRDRELALIARLRLARLLIHQQEAGQALRLLDASGLGPFAAQYSEVRGDAHVELGDVEAARSAYTEALAAPGAEWLNRSFLEMKLDALEAPAASVEPEA